MSFQIFGVDSATDVVGLPHTTTSQTLSGSE